MNEDDLKRVSKVLLEGNSREAVARMDEMMSKAAKIHFDTVHNFLASKNVIDTRKDLGELLHSMGYRGLKDDRLYEVIELIVDDFVTWQTTKTSRS